MAGKTQSYKKVLYDRTFFIACLLAVCPPLQAAAGCEADGKVEPVRVAYVFDGDTLLLTDDRRVRLIGINTPEIGRDGAPDEPHAREARHLLQSMVDDNGGRLQLTHGGQKQDRYHRLLAHLYGEKGGNITAALLRAGAGFAITIPPNLRHLDCYRQAEAYARKGRQGVWKRGPLVDAASLKGNESGFRLFRGEIDRVGKSRRAIWLNLKAGPALRIDHNDWRSYFEGWDTDRLPGRPLEARGWISGSKGQQRMRIHHPADIRWLGPVNTNRIDSAGAIYSPSKAE